jgi:signal recognition particle subunit SRP54
MFENLSERLERSFKLLKGESRITELNIVETLKDVRKALLDADVSYKVVKAFIDEVKIKAMGANVLTAVKPGEMMIKIVHDELVTLMGKEAVQININGDPATVLIAGLQGSGKTTFSGKLANYLKTKKRRTVPPGGLRRISSRCHRTTQNSWKTDRDSGICRRRKQKSCGNSVERHKTRENTWI